MLRNVRQKADHDCGIAVLISFMMTCGYSRKATERFVANVPCDEHFGTRPEAIEMALRTHFHTLAGEMTLSDLRHFTRTGRPVICAVDDHWIGVDEVNVRDVVYMDPATGRHARKSLHAFSEWWHDRGRFVAFRNFGIVAWPSVDKPQPAA